MTNTNLTGTNKDLTSLSAEEMQIINGGDGFFHTVGYVVGATLKTIWVFGKTAAEYQASLPPNLKK